MLSVFRTHGAWHPLRQFFVCRICTHLYIAIHRNGCYNALKALSAYIHNKKAGTVMKFSEKFIKANDLLCDFDSPVAAPYFRKEFRLSFVPRTAEITICGLGFYELSVNGINITKGPMAPYISNPDDVCYYDHYEVTPYLREGENVIGILLGNGMRNAFGGFVWDFELAKSRGPVITALHFLAEGNGKTLEFEADDSFKTHPSPVLWDDLRMGYRYDARLELPHWNEPGFDDSGWMPAFRAETPAGIAKLCTAEPIVITQVLKPVSVTHYETLPFAYESSAQSAPADESTLRSNVYVFDFGINTSGVTVLKINGKPGQKISIRHGEHLIRGNFSINTTIFKNEAKDTTKRYYDYNQRDVFICKGGKENFVPKVKYDGFRYAYVEGLEPNQLEEDTLTLHEMYSDIRSRASFSCSDPVLNKLQECTRRSDLTNFHYFPTDCPHREKNGWTGDASMSAEHMLLNLTAANSLKEWMTSIGTAQRYDGALPGIVPTGGWGFAWGNGPAWDSVCVNLPYYIYKFDGDLSAAVENEPTILRYLNYIMSRRNERGLIAIGLGDWVDPFVHITGQFASPLEFTDSAMIHDIAKKASCLFRAAKMDYAADFAENAAKEVRQAIRANLIDWNTMTVAGDCQTSQAVALETGLFQPEELPAARKRLVEIVHRDQDENHCGMIGLRYLFHALTNAGEGDLAYHVLTSRNRTGYGRWFEDGATTLYESFADPQEMMVDSRNHHFLGDISSWMIQEVAGIKPNPTVSDIYSCEISPNFITALTHAEASYNSVAGEIRCQWKRSDDGIVLTVQIPERIHGAIQIRDGYRCNGVTTLPLLPGCHDYLLKKVSEEP